jgi:hypothetical protein
VILDFGDQQKYRGREERGRLKEREKERGQSEKRER